MFEIPVKAGDLSLFTPLDDEDVKRLDGRKLSLGSHGYAQLWDEKHVTLVHRWVMGAKLRDGRLVDHQDGDTLNNLRENLRFVTASESSSNVRARGSSGILGVSQARSGRWVASGKLHGQQYYLGTYISVEEAAEVSHKWRQENLPGYTWDWNRDAGNRGRD